MRSVTLEQLFEHPITQKYVKRAGLAHAISASYHAFRLAKQQGVNPDLAVKAAFLHDMGHYTWYRNGEWDFELYRENDIHAIKGAERAHKLLIRLGEERKIAKEIALAVLLHTDSYLPEGQLYRSQLQQIVALADEMDEEPSGNHHYRKISDSKARKKIVQLDEMIDQALVSQAYEQTSEV
ncbi:HD domain-containing protein [Alteribacillus sp. YIM 98480]|uniref:HD domain-containing protein n=1 Tax=Alteribacillus sp. YIM 98480 TaxID=2606599 RepID=UPI00131CA92E|nr:HD domain-containing protein [Alteribacillus sp. YIM 98480]